MTESLIAPDHIARGAEGDVVPPGPGERTASDPAPSSVAAAAAIYTGPEEVAAETVDPPAEAKAPDAADEEKGAETPPSSYEPFALPEGVTIDTAALEVAQSLFAEARLSQPQAQKFVDLYTAKMNELTQRQVAAAEDRQAAWVAEVKNDPELGGRRFEAARAAAQKALARFGTPELRQTLNDLWVGNNPQLFRFFVRVGRAMAEDRYAGAASGAARPSAAETLYPNDK
jgi:hypothetical protein